MTKCIHFKKMLCKATQTAVIQLLLFSVFYGLSFARTTHAQELLNKEISLKMESVEVWKVLKRIESQANVKFVYSTKSIQAEQKTSVNVLNGKLSKVLDELLTPLDVSYEVVGSRILLRKKEPNSSALPMVKTVAMTVMEPVDQTVTGTVKDEKGDGMPGVTVLIKGSVRGTTTDASGHYSLSVPNGSTTLVFSFVGYSSQEIQVGNQSTISVNLVPENKALAEVVVVGYGTQKREQITTAVASVKAEDFVKGPVQDAAQLIRGKVAGLSVVTPDANPTATAQISLRGNATINASSSPLILIDGVPGALNTVAPEDIESIDVLKDGSAAAIYGTRGTNGVILITTRKVKGETPATLEINSYFTTQRMTRELEFMNADQYRQLVSQKKPGAIDYGSSTNWLEHVTQRPLSQVHNISLRGGSRTTNYIVSMEYRDLNGVMKKSDNLTFFPRIEVNHTMFNGILKFNANLSGYQQKYFAVNDGTYSGLVYRNALTFNPTDPLKDANGKWIERPEKTDYMNPVALLEETRGEIRNNNLRTYGTVSLMPIEGLEIKALLARDMYNSTRGYYETRQHWSTARNARNGFASRGTTRTQDDLFELTANYTKAINDHSLNLLGGYTWRKYNIEDYSMQNWDFPTDNFSYNNMNAGLALRRGQAPESSSQTENKLLGYFFRANYSFRSKYLLMASIRHEGSSRFGTNHKYGSFPAISAGWNIQKEDFMQGIRALSALKLRAGFGVTGTEPGSSYLSLNKINFNTYTLVNGQWVQAINPANNPNPDLRWERKEEINIGLDYGFLNDRISGSIDYYRRTTRDLIANFPVPTPPYLYSTITANAASMENKGVEIQLNVVPVRTADFEWSTSANFSTNANKILSLSNDKFALASGYFDTGNTGEPIQQTTHRVQVGQPLGNFWGFKTVDIDETGHWIIEGKDGQPKPIAQQQADDKQIIGNGLPKRYLNWNNTVSYKNFDLNVTMRGAFGFQILNMTEMFWSAPVMLTRGNLRSNAYEPIYGKRPLADDQSLNYVSYYIENGNYWKIDNVTLGYNLKLKSKYVKRGRVYLSTANLHTFTGYKGIDPEVSIGGLAPGIDDKNRYPAATSYTAGASFTF